MCERVVVCAWGADSVQSQLDGISRNKTVYQRVASMLSHDLNWALCTNHHEFKFVVRHDRSGLIQFVRSGLRYEIDVDRIWIKCGQA